MNESTKIKVDKQELLNLLKVTGHARAVKAAVPMYMCYRLEVTDKEMVITTADADFMMLRKSVGIENSQASSPTKELKLTMTPEEGKVVYVYGNT